MERYHVPTGRAVPGEDGGEAVAAELARVFACGQASDAERGAVPLATVNQRIIRAVMGGRPRSRSDAEGGPRSAPPSPEVSSPPLLRNAPRRR